MSRSRPAHPDVSSAQDALRAIENFPDAPWRRPDPQEAPRRFRPVSESAFRAPPSPVDGLLAPGAIEPMEASEIAKLRFATGLKQARFGAILGVDAARVARLEGRRSEPLPGEKELLHHLRLVFFAIPNSDDRKLWAAQLADMAERSWLKAVMVMLLDGARWRAKNGPAARRDEAEACLPAFASEEP